MSHRDSTSCPWNSMEAEVSLDRRKCHPGSLGLLVLYDSVVGSSAQARDAA